MKGLISNKELAVRFSETDAMGVVWHGNYLRYFEDARENFGKIFNIEYTYIHAQGFFVPITESSIKHKNIITYGDRIEIRTKFIYNKAAKIEFHYEIFNLTTNKISATGTSIQVFIDANSRDMILSKPHFFIEWEKDQNWMDV